MWLIGLLRIVGIILIIFVFLPLSGIFFGIFLWITAIVLIARWDITIQRIIVFGIVLRLIIVVWLVVIVASPAAP